MVKDKEKDHEITVVDDTSTAKDVKSVGAYEVLPSLDDKQVNLDEDEADVVEILAEPSDLSEEMDEALLPVLSELLPVPDSKGSDLTKYLQEISRYELLNREQELILTQKLKETGDIDIAKKLVMANLRLVVKIAVDYKYAYSNLMDLIQEGNIGLMKAVSLYDPDKGAKLSYYASWWIKSYILKFILDNYKLVKIGTTSEQKKLFYNLMKEKQKLLAQGIDPDHETLAKNLNVSTKAVALMDMRLSESGNEVSIDKKIGDSNASLGDFLESGDDFVDDLEFQQSLKILQDNLDDFVSTLKERDKEIFRERLLSEAPKSLQEIANDYGVSRERIRQIESRLIDNLKLYMSDHIR